jgi:hypothetical protein
MAWYNSDGLYVKFGTEQAEAASGGEYKTDGDLRYIEVEIPDLTALGTGSTILDDVTVVPAGAFIEKVVVAVDTAATSGGSAALNIGLIRTDRSTTYDADGLVAALALTSIDADGDVVEFIQGGTSHGALIGTELANNGLLVADYDTAVYTAGAIRVRVFYRIK